MLSKKAFRHCHSHRWFAIHSASLFLLSTTCMVCFVDPNYTTDRIVNANLLSITRSLQTSYPYSNPTLTNSLHAPKEPSSHSQKSIPDLAPPTKMFLFASISKVFTYSWTCSWTFPKLAGPLQLLGCWLCSSISAKRGS